MQWRIQRGSTTTITHRIPVQRQRCTTKVRSISGGDVRGGSFFLHSLLIDCVMRQQVFWVKINKGLVILLYFGWSGRFTQISNKMVQSYGFLHPEVM